MDVCSTGLMPVIDHDSEDSKDTNPEEIPVSVEEGDQILATRLLPCPSMDIRASSTISQRLAEAFQTNSEVLSLILDYLKEFTSVFSKQSFDTLPEPREWDHAVELIPGSKPSSCKIYPLSPAEQKELDIFLSRSSRMARPV